jgi:chromosome segregation ATPase
MFDHRKHSFEGKHISVPVSPGGLIYGDDERRQRSRSVGRHRSASVGRPQAARSRSSSRRRCRSPVSETNIRIVGRGEERVGRGFETYDQPRRRTQSTGRSSSRPPYDEDGESALFEEMDKPMRKSKMDKIRQLQAKNELYKEEFKRVQKDRKKLKKELEIKSNEITSLTREIDLHIEETSRLKVQLTEALMKIDQLDDSRDSTSVTRLSREMSQAKDDLAAALRRVSSLKDELADMQETIRRKDQQVESLSNEVATLQRSIAEVRNENKREGPPPEAVGDQNKMVSDLVEENNKLQEELGSTLERATTMVKEREEAIADLLKENDELKALLSDSVGNGENISSEVVENLQKELHRVTTTLEETQDRNLLLEEEVEAWLARGNEMEGVLDRLNQDVEMWQEKARTAESTAASLEGQVVDAKADASSAREALRDAEARHKADLEQLKAKHEAEMRDLHERAFAERVEKQSTESPQAMLLQQAVADQMMKKAKPSSWRKFLKAGDEDESLDDNQKRIKELEAQNAEREEEIKSLKSELVRLRSSYNEAAYVSKKQIDQLTDENEAYAQKVKSMEELLSSGTG